jgi:hypothetical protein
MNAISKLLAFVISVSAFLGLIRFATPEIGFCKISGQGKQTVTVCGGMVKFVGDDILSIYRISLVNTPWRSR